MLLVEPAFRLDVVRAPEESSSIKSDAVCIILDEAISGEHTNDLLDDILSKHRDVPVVVALEHNDVAAAVRYTHRGAFDCVVQPLDLRRLSVTFARIFLTISRTPAPEECALIAKSGIVGSDQHTRELRRRVAKVAERDCPVLIYGESGVGKEIVAHAIHRLSSRAERPFLAVNCSAIPEALFESELFGAERGAYTGAASRGGFFAAAHGGTLFLDEIGDLPLPNQAKLLRVLEGKSVTPLGSTRSRPADARCVCATHRNLSKLVREGRFRKDLYYRITAAKITVRPLRDRPGDIKDLIETYYRKQDRPIPKLSRGARERLLAHRWPGNVRELFNVLERREIQTEKQIMTAEELEFDTL